MVFPHISEWPRHVNLLTGGVALASYVLIAGRLILEAGAVQLPFAEMLPFPYPLTSTFLQLLSVPLLLLVAKYIPPVIINRLASYRNHASNGSITILDDEAGSISSRVNFAAAVNKVDNFVSPVVALKLLPLAITTAAEVALGNYALTFAPLEIYLLFRALILPVSIASAKYVVRNMPQLPMKALHASFLLSIGILVAAFRPDVPHPHRVLWAAALSALLAAVWPLQVQNVIQSLDQIPKPKYVQVDSGSEDEDDSTSMNESTNWNLGALWTTFYSVSVLSALVMLPVLLMSREISHIQRNCYLFDKPLFLFYLVLAGMCRCLLFVCSVLLIRATSGPDSTITFVLISASQVATLTFPKLLITQLLGLIMCICAAFGLYWNDRPPVFNSLYQKYRGVRIPWRAFTEKGWRQRPVFISGLVTVGTFVGYVTVWQLVHHRAHFQGRSLQDVVLYAATDGYLGERPHPDTVADIPMLVDACRGSYETMEKMRDVYGCLNFLDTNQDEYTTVLTDDNGEVAQIPPKTPPFRVPKCYGRIIPYHLWWSGGPTWRVELFIKSYLYTQNLGCSRLWIWINTDQDPRAAEKWLVDPGFKKFVRFIDLGYIIMEEWKLPSRIEISPDIDVLDRARYYKKPCNPNAAGEIRVADSIIRDSNGKEFIELYTEKSEIQLPYFTVATSDAARLIILHKYGGVYLDLDIILLRDMRPLLLPEVPFAERWGAFKGGRFYNNAVVSMPANSSISSYILRGGARMGLFYHFTVLGGMLVEEERDGKDNQGLIKLETAFFDPVWAELDGLRKGRCTVPCLTSWSDVFKARSSRREWESYEGVPIKGTDEAAGNRTMENFFRGAYAYHVHNQWSAVPENGSWIDVLRTAQDDFFAGRRPNAYGEVWTGPEHLLPYGWGESGNKIIQI